MHTTNHHDTKRASALNDAGMILDEFDKLTVDALVQPFRDWMSSIQDIVGEFEDLDAIVATVTTWDPNSSTTTRAVELSTKLGRAADIVEAYALASFEPKNPAVATMARSLFEMMTGGPALRLALMSDAELLGSRSSAAA